MPTYHNLPVYFNKDTIQDEEFKFLDSIDIENYLKESEWSVLKIMSEIQEDHGSKYEKESYIFNAISPDDFMEYVKKRYKGKYNFYIYSEIRVLQKGEE